MRGINTISGENNEDNLANDSIFYKTSSSLCRVHGGAICKRIEINSFFRNINGCDFIWPVLYSPAL